MMAAQQCKLFQNGEEVEEKQCLVTGAIPSWLQGHVIRNGPGEFDVGNDTFEHLFDGHGLLHKFCISNGSVTYSSKFIRSEVFKMNRKHNRIIYGSFGTASIPDPCMNMFSRLFTRLTSEPPGDVCNVNIAVLDNAHYAITDVGHAYKFDPETLDTETFVNFKEILNLPVSTAHPHYDSRGDYFNIGTSFGRESFYNIVQVPGESMTKKNPMSELKVHSKIKVEGNSMKPTYIHSFVLTKNFVVIHDQGMRMNIWKAIKASFTWEGAIDCMENDPSRDSYFHVIDRNTRTAHPVKYRANPMFCFHHINGYEVEEKGVRYLVVDMIAARGEKTFHMQSVNLKLIREQGTALRSDFKTFPYRFVLPLDVEDRLPGENLAYIEGCRATAKLLEDGCVFLEPELLVNDCDSIMELPQINYRYNGEKYKYFYGIRQTISPTSNGVFKFDVETKEQLIWEEKDCVPSEPIFVQRPGGTDEDDGIILSTVINLLPDQPIFLVILDAKTFTEIARAEINVALPWPLHGRFQMT